MTIRLPQLDPSGRHVIPPEWTYEQVDKTEGPAEADDIGWGSVDTDQAEAMVARCGFYTTVEAFEYSDFYGNAAPKFEVELVDWWMNFISWVDILASQDLLALGRINRSNGVLGGPELTTWTCDEHGRRLDEGEYQLYEPPRRFSTTFRILGLDELQACVAAASQVGAPPAEWLFIRDARSLLNAGDIRRAIIDAAAAAELAMTVLIDNCLNDQLIDQDAMAGIRKALENASKTLGGKKSVLALLRPTVLPERVQDGLIDCCPSLWMRMSAS